MIYAVGKSGRGNAGTRARAWSGSVCLSAPQGHVFRFGIGSGRQHTLTPNSYKKIKTGGR